MLHCAAQRRTRLGADGPHDCLWPRRGLASSSSSWWSRDRDDDDDEEDDLNRDWYRVLDVEPDADAAAIKAAYRARSKECHPDVNQSPMAARSFRRVRKAYEVLSSPVKRREFDAHYHYRQATGMTGVEASVRKRRPRTGVDRFVNHAEAFFSKNLRWAFVGLLPLWMVVYVGVSTLQTKDPKRFDGTDAATSRTQSSSSGASQPKERMVRAGRSTRTGEWLEPNSYENLRKLGPNKQLRMVPESWVTK